MSSIRAPQRMPRPRRTKPTMTSMCGVYDLCPGPREPPRLHAPFTLHLDRPAGTDLQLALEQPRGVVAHLDAVRLAVGFHAGGGIHGVAPEVVAELVLADHARHHRAALHPDAQAQRAAVRGVVLA